MAAAGLIGINRPAGRFLKAQAGWPALGLRVAPLCQRWQAIGVRLATWNVNSVKARLPRLLEWLDEAKPDIVCLQEIKTTTALFPAAEVEELGYEVAAHGEGRWNGVALLSTVGLENVSLGFPGEPSYEGEEAEPTLLDEPGLGLARSAVPAAGSGSGRCTRPTGAPRNRRTTPTSWPGTPRCAPCSRPS